VISLLQNGSWPRRRTVVTDVALLI